MYAIFHAKGKQWRAEPGATLKLPSLDAEPGERVTFDQVLLAERDDEVLIGRPSLEGASVSIEVMRHGKGEKIIVFKRKRRKNYRRKYGHRQPFTEVKIVEIDLEGATAPAPEPEEPEEPEAAVETAEEAAVEPEEEEAAAAEAEAEEIDITPAAAELAEEHDLDLTTVDGTGKDGRILKSDVESAIKEREEE